MSINNLLSALPLVLFATFIAVEGNIIPKKVHYDLNLSETVFQSFKTEYKKSYSTEEEKYRSQVFSENLKRINELNKKHENAVFGINKFTDLTPDEFKRLFLGSKNVSNVEPIQVPVRSIPDELDYRKQNLVTKVRSQEYCRSDYITSAIGEIEAQFAKKHKKLITLSDQYPMDCYDQFTCDGGGAPGDVMKWLSGVPGALTLDDYPDGEFKYECFANSSLGVVKVKSAKEYELKTDAELKQSLVDHGPLSIGIYVSFTFQTYLWGVLDPLDCVGDYNHFILLVGYGKDKEDYWLLKNSWSSDWGEDGYVRLAVGKCDVGSYIASSEVL